MSKSNRPNSPKSPSSVQSLGMGDKPQTPEVQTKIEEQDLPRPLPEGILTSNDPVYDCVVYVIYCREHEKIAVTNINKCKCVWLPFVPLTDGVTWMRAAHDGVAILIGRADPEMDAEEAERIAPHYFMWYLQVFRLQLPSQKIVTRLALYVQLQKNHFFLCCINTDRVNWISVSDVQQNRVYKVWGPELKMLTKLLCVQCPLKLRHFSLKDVLHYRYLNGSWQQELLKAFKLTDNHVYDIYTDFVEHCYPSLAMCEESLRVWYLKNGLVWSDAQLSRLFKAFCSPSDDGSPWFIEFPQFLISVVTMEPNCPNKLEARLQLIFRYYDFEQKGHLTGSDICTMLKDASPAWPDAKIVEESRQYMNNRAQLNYAEFVATFQPKLGNLLYHVCRSSRSMLKQISTLLSHRNKERKKTNLNCERVLKARRTTKGTCWSCRVQQYEYGNHYVTIDPEGRLVEPTLIPVTTGHNATSNSQQASSSSSINRSRYSLEYIFTMGSAPNIFLEMIRDFNQAAVLRRNPQITGLMTIPQEWYVFHKYLRIMCNELCAMLSQELKLMRINAPAIVVGDLRGNLRDLLQLEKLFWQSFPVVPEKLVFLGNYSGDGYPYGIECLIYLFALKLLSPNKVYLCRGGNEASTSTSGALKNQCINKYGAEHGKIIYSIMMQIYARIPIAVVVDDNVLCTHSGIPTSVRLDQLGKAPVEMTSLAREHPMAFEILTRYPKDALPDLEASGGSGKSGDSIGANVSQALFGGKVGDRRHHVSFKSNSRNKQKIASSTKSKSVKSLKNAPSVQKSAKSLKSSKSLKSKTNSKAGLDLTKSSKSLKSQKSAGSPVKSHSPTTEQSLQIKSAKSVISRIETFKLDIVPKKGPKLKLNFLSNKSNRADHKGTKSHRAKSAKRGKPGTGVSLGRRDKTFDRAEYTDFMAANDFACLIRSGSTCQHGFKISYQHCITIFSCSNHANRNNEASVALIDGSSYSVRVIRNATSCTPYKAK